MSVVVCAFALGQTAFQTSDVIRPGIEVFRADSEIAEGGS
jgi:hypothetical protein